MNKCELCSREVPDDKELYEIQIDKEEPQNICENCLINKVINPICGRKLEEEK